MNPNLAIEPGASHCMENGQYFSIQGKSSQSWTMPSRLLDKPNEQIIGFPFVRYIAIPIEPAGRTYLDQMVACIPLHIPLYLILYPMHSQYKYIPFQIRQKSSNCTSHCRPPDLPPDIPGYIYFVIIVQATQRVNTLVFQLFVTPGDLLLEACRWPRCGNRAELGTK